MEAARRIKELAEQEVEAHPPMSDESTEIEGWRESRQLVMSELRRVGRIVESLDTNVRSEVTNMKVEIATIKTKVAIYAAAIAAVASILLSALISFLSRR